MQSVLSSKAARLLAPLLALGLLALASWGRIAALWDHNESVYITAGDLIRKDYRLYEDFAFLQMPGLAWIYGFVFRVFPSVNPYLLGKGISWLAFIGSGLVLLQIARGLHLPWRISACLPALFWTNTALLRAFAEVSNYAASVFFTLLSLYFLDRSLGNPRLGRTHGFLSGATAGLASSIKLFNVALIVPMLWMFWRTGRRPPFSQKAPSETLCFLAGLLLASLPALWLLQRNPDAFVFNNLQFHFLSGEFYEEAGYPRAMTFMGKIAHSFDLAWNRPENFLLILGLGVIAWNSRRSFNHDRNERGMTPRMALLLFALAAVWLPRPLWIQYWSLPIAVSFYVGVHLLSHSSAALTPRLAPALIVAAALSCLFHASDWRTALDRAVSPEAWKPVEMRTLSNALRERLAAHGSSGRVAAQMTLIPLLSDLEYYPEFASGPFAYSIAWKLTPEARRRFNIVSSDDLDSLFRDRPPAAVLTGFETNPMWQEKALEDWAVRNGYSHDPEFYQEFGLHLFLTR